MVPLSVKEVFSETVGDVAYRFKVPTMMKRAAYRRDVQAMGAVFHSQTALIECEREGVKKTVVEEQREELLELLDSWEYESGIDAATRTPEQKESYEVLTKKVEEIESQLRVQYNPYAQMEADRGYWLAVAPFIAFRHFVIGWEGSNVKYVTEYGSLSEGTVNMIPESHVTAVGYKIMASMNPGESEIKNSEPQLQSPPAPLATTAEPKPQTEAKDGS